MTEEQKVNDELENKASDDQKVTDENPAEEQENIETAEPVDVAVTPEKTEEETETEATAEVEEQPLTEEPEAVKAEEEPAEEAAPVAEEEKPATEEIQAEEAEAEVVEVKEEEATPEIPAEETGEQEVKAEEVKPVEIAETSPEPPEFDWDITSKKHESYSANERLRLEGIYDKTLSSIVEHEVIDGTVVAISNREVVVNIGYKSDGVIPVNEMRYNPDLKIGDTLEVYVESQEDTTGQLILSHKKARILRSWERVNAAYEKDEIIKGYVKCRTKGGLIVDVFGIEAFLPGSQIDVKPIRDYDVYVDKVMEFKVVKINHEYKNVVVSHKALIEDELEQQRAEIIAKLEKGQVLEGMVKNITSYGVFVDLGGVDGLIHITDLSWGRINHPNEIVELDQKIKVAILDFDENKKRIALGLKQLTPHPWDSLDAELKVGDKVKGKVVVLADYGAFVEIAPGVEGLIHVSEMSWSQHLRTAQDFLKVGDEVEAMILTLDREDRKMSLGIKQLIPDPWEDIQSKYPLNSKHKAVVRNFTNFGIFVELEEGVDGLIHISDLSWSKKIKHPAEFTKVGEEMEVIVLDVDAENRRLSLGHKQLEENPWDVFETVFTPGSIHKGTILNQADKGMIVTLPYGVEGFAPMRHLQKDDNTTPKIDETLDFKVLEFSKDNKKIILSHSRVHQDTVAAERSKEKTKAASEEESTQRTVRRMKDSMEKTTLGDIAALANLKSDMEESEKAEKKTKAREASKKEEEEGSED
jgi:small subunit ribosomal protein S1